MGDLVVVSGRDTSLAATPEWHDLKAVAKGLRSHGGRYEEIVPFVLSERLNAATRAERPAICAISTSSNSPATAATERTDAWHARRRPSRPS
jgi:hypothetical protein